MRKRSRKNLILTASIEGVILLIMVFIAVMAYRLELERERAGYKSFMRDVMDWEYEENEPESEPDIYRIYDTLNRARSGRQYGVAMSLMDVYGTVFSRTQPMNQIMAWRPALDGRDEVIQLDLFFSKEDLDEMVSMYYQLYHAGDKLKKKMEVQKMQGYYNGDGDYVPVKIIFGETEKHNITYILVNKEAKERAGEDRLFWRFNAMGSRERIHNEPNEYGRIVTSFNETKREYNERAHEKMDSGRPARGVEIVPEEDIYETPLRIVNEKSRIRSYRVSFYADLEYITLHSEDFHKDVLMIVVFCQMAGTVIISCVLLTNKRRLRLQQMRNTFINAMAHEMKTPAAVVKSGAECIRAGIHPEKQKHYIELIDREADHMNDLLNAMLVYTKVADTGYHIKKEPVRMEEVCQEVSEHYQIAIREKQIILDIDERASFHIKGDPALLQMVVDNLFSNAVRHCPPGRTIRLVICQNSLSMFNTGEHIPEDELDRIWEPLYQVDAARSGDNSSSGMGLAISAQILKLHRIRYSVRNVTEGVEFSLTQ